MTKSAFLILVAASLCSAWSPASRWIKFGVSDVKVESRSIHLSLVGNDRVWFASPLFASRNDDSGVKIVSLECLTDHETEGSLLAASLVRWLDVEWMPQEIHVTMGQSAKQSYLQARDAGETDIMSVMIRVANDLRADWKIYDKDAFVNEWDIANYCSDYFTQRSGNEACDCSTEIF